MSHRQRASTLRHSWVSERLFLWQQKTYFLIQTVRFRKGYSAAVSRFHGFTVSRWQEKIVSDKRGKKKNLRNSFCLFSSQNISFRGELLPFYSWPGTRLRINGLPAFCLNFFENVRHKERVVREHLFQILISKRSRGCGEKSAGPSPGPTHLPQSLPHPPSCSLQDKMKLWHTTGAPGPAFSHYGGQVVLITMTLR